MIFGVWNTEKIWHQYLVYLPTLPVYCSHFTFGSKKNVIFQLYYSYILQIIYIISEETNCNCCTAAYLFTYCCLLFLLFV